MQSITSISVSSLRIAKGERDTLVAPAEYPHCIGGLVCPRCTGFRLVFEGADCVPSECPDCIEGVTQ